MTGSLEPGSDQAGPVPEPGDPAATEDLTGTVSWGELLAETTVRLTEGDVDASSPASEARWIIEEASGFEGTELAVGLDRLATERGVAHLDAMVARRLAGEPIQYVLGHWPFRTLDLLCDRRVLIPRPETEQVVGHALEALDDVLVRRPDRHRSVAVDLGTGSGAIALSVAAERRGTEVWAVDRSPDAVAVARANLAGLGMAGASVRVVEGSWFDPLPEDLEGRVDLIVTNPPYIAADEDLDASVTEWEPIQALVPGPTGLEAYQVILTEARRWLAPDGALVAEIGHTQSESVKALAAAVGFTDITVHPDHAGHPRTLVAHNSDR